MFGAIDRFTTVHETFGEQLWHDIESVGILAGLIASAIGIAYFAIQKHIENNDKKEEYEAFESDLKTEVEFFSKVNTEKHQNTYDKIKKIRKGNLHTTDFFTFDMFNQKYRHLYNSETRNKIGDLKMAIKNFNQDEMELRELEHEVILKKLDKFTEYESKIDLHNRELKQIADTATIVLQLIKTSKKPNGFKQQLNKLTS